jgi:hypothetical protein
MYDEDTGDAVECPFCGSEDDCPHLLAVLDRSFNECNGGYAYSRFHEFAERITETFERELKAGRKARKPEEDGLVAELWEYAVEAYPESKEVELDDDVLFNLVAELFDDAGGEEYPGSIIVEGGPGYTSALTVFHAEDPARVFERALSGLQQRLNA